MLSPQYVFARTIQARKATIRMCYTTLKSVQMDHSGTTRLASRYPPCEKLQLHGFSILRLIHDCIILYNMYPDIYSGPNPWWSFLPANSLSFGRDTPRPCMFVTMLASLLREATIVCLLNVAVHTRYVILGNICAGIRTNQPITSSWLLPDKLMVAQWDKSRPAFLWKSQVQHHAHWTPVLHRHHRHHQVYSGCEFHSFLETVWLSCWAYPRLFYVKCLLFKDKLSSCRIHFSCWSCLRRRWRICIKTVSINHIL